MKIRSSFSVFFLLVKWAFKNSRSGCFDTASCSSPLNLLDALTANTEWVWKIFWRLSVEYFEQWWFRQKRYDETQLECDRNVNGETIIRQYFQRAEGNVTSQRKTQLMNCMKEISCGMIRKFCYLWRVNCSAVPLLWGPCNWISSILPLVQFSKVEKESTYVDSLATQ